MNGDMNGNQQDACYEGTDWFRSPGVLLCVLAQPFVLTVTGSCPTRSASGVMNSVFCRS